MATNEYLRLRDTELNKKKAENQIAIIEQKRKDAEEKKEVQSESSLFAELFKAFKEFFANLGRPTLKKRKQKKGSPARSKDYNNTAKEIVNDIDVGYKEVDSLSSVVVKNFNYSEAERQALINKVKKLSSRSVDYSFYSEGAKTNSLFGIDDFVDNSKIDPTKVSTGIYSAELVTNQGVITLKRMGNENRAPLVGKVTGVQESLKKWIPSTETGGYEGLYFGVKNEPRPEGGKYHLRYSTDGNNLYEMGAPEEELMPRRLEMFDDNPDTFWECEYISKAITGYKNKYSGVQISVAEFNELVNNEIDSPNVETRGDVVVTDEHGSLIEDYVPITESGLYRYLNVTFDVHLDHPEILNWISLNPQNFGQEKYVEVLSIQISADGQAFEELEGFDDYEYDRVLTSRVNEELTPDVVKDTLSPDRFQFAGQGIWVFSPKKTKVIRFHIRQTRSYPKLYEMLMVEVSQTFTISTTTSTWFGLSEETETRTETIRKDIEIPYLIGQVTGFDVMSLEPGGLNVEIDPESGYFDPLSEQEAGVLIGAGVGTLLAGPGFGTLIGGLIGWVFGDMFGSVETEVNSGPQRLTKQWTVTKNDRDRFAIGIRDINLYSYRFAENSEVVSKPYTSPKPIDKVSLAVEEQTPKVFYEGDLSGTENNWIKYYISADDGTTWVRISPRNHRTTRSETGKYNLPEIININSSIDKSERDNPLAYLDTGSAVYAVRFKAVLSRPTTINDAESYTPVLSKYALQIYPKGGL